MDPFVKDMIADVDQSTVMDSGVVESPVLGKIPPGGSLSNPYLEYESDCTFHAGTGVDCRGMRKGGGR